MGFSKKWFLLFSVLLAFGCSRGKPLLIETHDEVISAPYAMDYTYLRTLEAIQAHADWELDRTNKELGLIHIRNLRYSSFADADQRMATIILRRAGPRLTTIQFAKESQGVVGGDEILKLIKKNLALD